MSNKKNINLAGMKKTKARESVFKVLEEAKIPLSAMDIYKEVKQTGISVWLSTIYRILDISVEKGVVVKTSIINSDMALYELNRFKHKHYAVCINCHKIIPINDCPIEKYNPKTVNGFKVIGHNLEVYGYCKDCNLIK